MTPLQKTKYFKLWRAACLANDWTTAAACAVADQDETVMAKSRLHASTLTFARQLAQAEHRAITAGDLRHGLHIAAIGYPKSSKTMTNPELDRVFTALELLADPDNLRAAIAQDHPEDAARRRLLWLIRKSAPEAYIAAVAEGKFTTRHWEELTNRQLTHLLVTLKRRSPWRQQRHTQHTNATTTPTGIECPF